MVFGHVEEVRCSDEGIPFVLKRLYYYRQRLDCWSAVGLPDLVVIPVAIVEKYYAARLSVADDLLGDSFRRFGPEFIGGVAPGNFDDVLLVEVLQLPGGFLAVRWAV